jgi:hypothetical protein
MTSLERPAGQQQNPQPADVCDARGIVATRLPPVHVGHAS